MSEKEEYQKALELIDPTKIETYNIIQAKKIFNEIAKCGHFAGNVYSYVLAIAFKEETNEYLQRIMTYDPLMADELTCRFENIKEKNVVDAFNRLKTMNFDYWRKEQQRKKANNVETIERRFSEGES